VNEFKENLKMDEEKIVYFTELNEENIGKILSYLMDNKLGYKGGTIAYLEEENRLHVYYESEIDEYLEIKGNLEVVFKLAVEKIDALFPVEKQEVVEKEEMIEKEQQEEIGELYKGKHIVFKRMRDSLIVIKVLLFVFAVIQGVAFLVMSAEAGSLLYGILSSIGTILEMIFLMFFINYLLTIVESLMEMDEDIEGLKIKE